MRRRMSFHALCLLYIVCRWWPSDEIMFGRHGECGARWEWTDGVWRGIKRRIIRTWVRSTTSRSPPPSTDGVFITFQFGLATLSSIGFWPDRRSDEGIPNFHFMYEKRGEINFADWITTRRWASRKAKDWSMVNRQSMNDAYLYITVNNA